MIPQGERDHGGTNRSIGPGFDYDYGWVLCIRGALNHLYCDVRYRLRPCSRVRVSYSVLPVPNCRGAMGVDRRPPLVEGDITSAIVPYETRDRVLGAIRGSSLRAAIDNIQRI